MARITVEDCAEVVENRFELVVIAANRAKSITSGSPILVERDNDKNAVVALREIGDRKIDVNSLRETTVQSFQKRLKRDSMADSDYEDDADTIEMMEDISEEIAAEMEEVPDDTGLDDVSFGEDNLDVED